LVDPVLIASAAKTSMDVNDRIMLASMLSSGAPVVDPVPTVPQPKCL
jgi:hypothetical protein